MTNSELRKKAWIVPELVVLIRNKPEETVLVACKSGTWPGKTGDPNTNDYTCIYNNPTCAPDCNAHADS